MSTNDRPQLTVLTLKFVKFYKWWLTYDPEIGTEAAVSESYSCIKRFNLEKNKLSF